MIFNASCDIDLDIWCADEKYWDELVADVLIRTDDSVMTLPGGATDPDDNMLAAVGVGTLTASPCDDDKAATLVSLEADCSLAVQLISFLGVILVKPLLLLNDLHPRYLMPATKIFQLRSFYTFELKIKMTGKYLIS